MDFGTAAEQLQAAYERNRQIAPEEFSRLVEYRQFIAAAEQDGYTGPEVGMDLDFAVRTPDWLAVASEQQMRAWVNALVRADRWNGDYPDALLNACSHGCVSAMANRGVEARG